MAYKRFVLFVSQQYYPRIGWSDFKGDFDTLKEAKKEFLEWKKDGCQAQIVDLEEKRQYHFYMHTDEPRWSNE